ncbi:MAG: hypothetical protein RLN83_01740 [Balneola sp.]
MTSKNSIPSHQYWYFLVVLIAITSCKNGFNFEPSTEAITVEKMVDASLLYPDENGDSSCESLMATKKGFMCVGYYYDSQNNEYINAITTWDNEGNALHINEFSSPKSSSSFVLNSVDKYINTSDGSIVALGLASNMYTAFKFNSDGEMLWEKELLSFTDYKRYSISLFEGDDNYFLLASDDELQTKHSTFEISKDGSEINEEVTESEFRRFTVRKISNDKAIFVGANTNSLSGVVKIADINGKTIKEKDYPTLPLSFGVFLDKSRSYLLIDNRSRGYKTDKNLNIEWDTSLSGFSFTSSEIIETEAGNFLYNTQDEIYLYSIEGDLLDEYLIPPESHSFRNPIKLTNGNIVISAYAGASSQLIFFNTSE